MSRCDSPKGLTEEDGRTQDLIGTGELYRLVDEPAAYFIEHVDGLKTTLLMLNGAIGNYCFAARLKSEPNPLSTQFFLTPTPPVTYSACLVSKIEEMLKTGVSPIPVERTLTVCGILDYCLDSKQKNGIRINTPDHRVQYRAPEHSQHCGAAQDQSIF